MAAQEGFKVVVSGISEHTSETDIQVGETCPTTGGK